MNEINYKLLQQVHQLKPLIRTKVIGVGSYLPKQRVKSIEIMEEIKTEIKYNRPHNWMSKEMGIIERRVASENQRPSDLAIKAANAALQNSPNLDPDDIGAVIFCGIERDMPEPATAHFIQRSLGLRAQYVFDVANACFGFFQALNLASNLIENRTIEYGLVVTGEVSTRVAKSVIKQLKEGVSIAQAKHLWGILSVGDAGGAMIIGPEHEGTSGFMKFHQLSQSEHSQLCYYNWGANGEVNAHMNMGHIVARGLKLNRQAYQEAFKQLGWDTVDWVIAHQTGQAAFEQVRKIHGVQANKFMKTYPKLGNITTATLPLSFQKLISSGSLKAGNKIGGLFAGSGLVGGQFGYLV